jgi:hypothetical protein
MKSQGTADRTESYRTPHSVRGSESPIGGGRPTPYVLHRDEDVASAPMTRQKGGTIPQTNRVGGITIGAGKGLKDVGT